MDFQKVREIIEKHEGFRGKIYLCPAKKLTLGYGFNVEDTALPKKVADYWLNYLINEEFLPALSAIFPNFYEFSEPRQIALLSMIFNLGATRFKTFEKTISYINQGLFIEASIEMLDSKWACQVGSRAHELSKMIKYGWLH